MANLEIYCLTDTGGRSRNEDRLLAKSLKGLHLLAVADGLGGHAAGEVASSVALVEVEESLKTNLGGGDMLNAMKEAISKANREICLLSRENPAYAGMSTTLVMALVRQGKVVIANVGDSRAYQVSGSRIRRITKDHSVVQGLIEQGLIIEKEALHHPERSTLTRALGLEPEVEMDAYDIQLLPGDILLLCSDGLTDSLGDEEIRQVIGSSGKLDEACAKLIRQARENGGRDNISVILSREKRG